MHHDLRKLMDKYEEMTKKIGTSFTVDQLLSSTNLPFCVEIMAIPLPPKFKVPSIDIYDESKDSMEYLKTLKAHITLHRFPGEITCMVFPLTLKGITRG